MGVLHAYSQIDIAVYAAICSGVRLVVKYWLVCEQVCVCRVVRTRGACIGVLCVVSECVYE